MQCHWSWLGAVLQSYEYTLDFHTYCLYYHIHHYPGNLWLRSRVACTRCTVSVPTASCSASSTTRALAADTAPKLLAAANLAGVPGISLPSGLSADDGLPVGIQFLAPARQDARLYRVGAALEALLLDEWGGPLLDRAPVLSASTGGRA